MTSATQRRMLLGRRAAYLRRILQVYLFPKNSPLAFWYETPEVNEGAFRGTRGYYMRFRGKADYPGPFDPQGIPLLDYRGDIGRQYNPIAIAQYGLARYNRLCESGETSHRAAFLRVADWLVEHLEANDHGVRVWRHHFDWVYREPLRAPWYSGLAQGQGIAVLVRAAQETADVRYANAAREAFVACTVPVSDGGVLFRDAEGNPWIEEYIVDPPSHILNGFIWALWGVYDLGRWQEEIVARKLFDECVVTVRANLARYDTGGWSLYELLPDGSQMVASGYYHRLHIVQLEVMHRLTGDDVFLDFARRWHRYAKSPRLRTLAFLRKVWFKLRRY